MINKIKRIMPNHIKVSVTLSDIIFLGYYYTSCQPTCLGLDIGLIGNLLQSRRILSIRFTFHKL